MKSPWKKRFWKVTIPKKIGKNNNFGIISKWLLIKKMAVFFYNEPENLSTYVFEHYENHFILLNFFFSKMLISKIFSVAITLVSKSVVYKMCPESAQPTHLGHFCAHYIYY